MPPKTEDFDVQSFQIQSRWWTGNSLSWIYFRHFSILIWTVNMATQTDTRSCCKECVAAAAWREQQLIQNVTNVAGAVPHEGFISDSSLAKGLSWAEIHWEVVTVYCAFLLLLFTAHLIYSKQHSVSPSWSCWHPSLVSTYKNYSIKQLFIQNSFYPSRSEQKTIL